MLRLSQLSFRFLPLLLLASQLAAQTITVTPKNNVVLKLDPISGQYLVKLADVATVSAPADATVTVSPSQFDCSSTGQQTVTVTVATKPQVQFNDPAGIVTDSQGDFFISDAGNHQIKKIAPDGTVTTIAGSGLDGNADGKGIAATFGDPAWLAIDRNGNLYVLDFEYNQIRKVAPDGTVTTINPYLNWTITSIAVDASNNLYIASGYEIVKMATDGTFSVFAGSALNGSQDGKGTAATFDFINGLSFDQAGNLWVCDYGNGLIRKITPDGTVSTVPFGHQFLAFGCSLVDAKGNFFTSDENVTINELPAGQINGIDFAGYYSNVGFKDGVGEAAAFSGVGQLTIDNNGNLYVTDQNNNAIRKITPGAVVTTFAGGAQGNENGNINNSGISVVKNIPVTVESTIQITSGLPNVSLPVSSNCPTTLPDYTKGLTVADVCSNNITYTQVPTVGTLVNGNSPIVVTITARDNHYGSASASFTVTPDATPIPAPTVTISASLGTVCTGTPVTFTASAQNVGTNPSYQWLVNGVSLGNSSASFEITPLNGDAITCMVTTSLSCTSTVSSNKVIMNVNSLVLPSVTLNSNGNDICAGSPEVITANATNCGPNPSFTWLLNGIVTTVNGPVYTNSNLADGDQVTCTVTTSPASCVTANTASASLGFKVSPLVKPTLQISGPGGEICSGSEATFTASGTNTSSDATSVAGQWRRCRQWWAGLYNR